MRITEELPPESRHPHEYTDFVLSLVRAYVSFPERVEAESVMTKYGFKVLLKCSQEDMGKLIGAGGANIAALKSLVQAAAIARKHGQGDVFVLQPTQGEPHTAEPFEVNLAWDGMKEVVELIEQSIQFVRPATVVLFKKDEEESREGFSAVEAILTQKVSLEVEQAFHTIFAAIGGQNGHKIQLTIR